MFQHPVALDPKLTEAENRERVRAGEQRWLPAFFEATLRSLSRSVTNRQWEIIVVDNNSADDTRAVVARHTAVSAVPVTYLFEPRQGKSNALNTGMARAFVGADDDGGAGARWRHAAHRCGAARRPRNP